MLESIKDDLHLISMARPNLSFSVETAMQLQKYAISASISRFASSSAKLHLNKKFFFKRLNRRSRTQADVPAKRCFKFNKSTFQKFSRGSIILPQEMIRFPAFDKRLKFRLDRLCAGRDRIEHFDDFLVVHDEREEAFRHVGHLWTLFRLQTIDLAAS